MATRTAPTVSGTPTFKQVTIATIDHTGNLRSDSEQVPAGATNAQIEATIAALQALSNGSIYKVEVQDVYNSVADSGNADEVVWEDVRDNVVVQFKTALNVSRRLFIPAPLNTMFVENTESIDPTNADLAALLTAGLALFGAGFTVVGARLSKRSRRGRQQKI